MNVKDFLNACMHFESVIILEFTGDINSIGAEPEDYTKISEVNSMKDIPEEILSRKVEYFYMQDEVVDIYLQIK